MKDKHAVELLKIQLKHDLKMKKLGEALGEQCDIHEIFPLDLLDIVADLLGVPKDNYDDLPPNHRGGPNGVPNYYSRDWVWERWFECRDLEDPIGNFITIMNEDAEEYNEVINEQNAGN